MQIAKLNRIHTLILAAVAMQFAFANPVLSQDANAQDVKTRTIQHRKFAPGVVKDIPSQLDVRRRIQA